MIPISFSFCEKGRSLSFIQSSTANVKLSFKPPTKIPGYIVHHNVKKSQKGAEPTPTWFSLKSLCDWPGWFSSHANLTVSPAPVSCVTLQNLTAFLTLPDSSRGCVVRLSFCCPLKGHYCLYAKSSFNLTSRHPHLWIHLMLLHLQVQTGPMVFRILLDCESK